jgi:hypothetical protein
MILFMLVWNVLNIDGRWTATPQFDPQRPNFVVGYDETRNPLFHVFEITGHALGVGQHFQMFGRPPSEDAWFIYRGRLADGSERDVFWPGRDLNQQRTLIGRDSIPNHHWRQIHRNALDPAAYAVRQRMAVYAAEQWNRTHPANEQIAQLRLECYSDTYWPTPTPGEAKGAIIWGTYPDGPTSPFEGMLHQSKMSGIEKGF